MTTTATGSNELAPSSGVTTPSTHTKPKISKRDQLHKLLDRPHGATMTQIEAQLGWQPHTIRAAVSRIRTGGIDVELDKSGTTARYRIVTSGAA